MKAGRSALDLVGPVLCALGALSLLGALVVRLDSTAAKVLMAAAAILFLPGGYLTLASVRRHVPPR
ncbi:MAG: hypothetical protein EXQ77_05675 [Thermoleophilia bacterium]|nr:hypothetical protein [Thermoleophilia bacterium]